MQSKISGWLKKNPTLANLDTLRKDLNKIQFNTKAKINPVVSTAIKNSREDLISKFPEQYQEINNKFRSIFDVRDEFRLGGKLSRKQVESTLSNLFKKNKAELRQGLQVIDDFLPAEQKFLETVEDELAVKAFREVNPNFLRIFAGSGIATAAVGPGAGVGTLAAGTFLTSPRAASLAIRGGQALGRAQGTATRQIQRGLGGAARQPLVQRGLAVQGLQREE
ncbi:unnamed protein product [marine sediment metagenome]|uniref:Uncharacterized protein n=1 Tax=marine sediment metagenome TaxID=412755 RepID=X0XL57_9ZZZZ